MKNLVFLIVAFVFATGTSFGAGMANTSAAFGNSRSFIFTEGDVTFSVFPDGEFDFYHNGQVGFQTTGFRGQGAITFNSGFNYNPFVQYDDFGAVIQIAQLPIFYDYFGRVSRIGNIHMNYRNGRLHRLGGMRIFYNGFGYYDYHLGYINPFNRVYVFQPFHRFFIRPAAAFCMVYPQPYRRYYHPVRYTYHRPYHNNVRRVYANAGRPLQYRERAERSRIYRNDRRVVARSAGAQRNVQRSVAGRTSSDRSARATQVRRSSARTGAVVQRGQGVSGNNRSLAVSRTNNRKAAVTPSPGRSGSSRQIGRSVKQQRVSSQGVARKSTQSDRRSTGLAASKNRVNRSATTSRSGNARSGRVSPRSPQ